MLKNNALLATLTVTTVLTAGIALAAEQAAAPAANPQLAKVNADLGQLNHDSATAYYDVSQARLAIFDGRTADAKKMADEADAAFQRAKTDRSVFMKAETELKAPNDTTKAANEMAAKAMGNNTKAQGGADKPATKDSADMTKPVAWLPVAGDVLVNEDFKMHPEKAAALKAADQSLKKGDKKGALDNLKLANVDVDYVVAVVPLETTLADIHQAAQDIDAGKYYEGSQSLRMIQASLHYDVLDVATAPKAGSAPTAATHDSGTKSN